MEPNYQYLHPILTRQKTLVVNKRATTMSLNSDSLPQITDTLPGIFYKLSITKEETM